MRPHPEPRHLFFTCLIPSLLFLHTACSNHAVPETAPTEPPSAELEHAWAFAEAITMDDKDRSRSQARVVGAMLEDGQVERSRELADRIENWRRGVVLADLMYYQTLSGTEAFPAQDLLDEARAVAAETEGWRLTRINEHIGQAKAVMGLPAEVSAIRDRFSSNPVVLGKLGAYEALALARQGKTSEALDMIQELGMDQQYDVQIWKSRGYLLLAQDGGFENEQTLSLLNEAVESAENVPGFRKQEIRMEAVKLLVDAQATEHAAKVLNDVTYAVQGLSQPANIKAPLLAKVAINWAYLNHPEKIEALHPEVMALIASEDIYDIERPSALALLAEAHAVSGNDQQALALYAQAVEEATALVNPRPRALAAVDISLSMHRGAFDSLLLENSLNKLHNSFNESGE